MKIVYRAGFFLLTSVLAHNIQAMPPQQDGSATEQNAQPARRLRLEDMTLTSNSNNAVQRPFIVGGEYSLGLRGLRGKDYYFNVPENECVYCEVVHESLKPLDPKEEKKNRVSVFFGKGDGGYEKACILLEDPKGDPLPNQKSIDIHAPTTTATGGIPQGRQWYAVEVKNGVKAYSIGQFEYRFASDAKICSALGICLGVAALAIYVYLGCKHPGDLIESWVDEDVGSLRDKLIGGNYLPKEVKNFEESLRVSRTEYYTNRRGNITGILGISTFNKLLEAVLNPDQVRFFVTPFIRTFAPLITEQEDLPTHLRPTRSEFIKAGCIFLLGVYIPSLAFKIYTTKVIDRSILLPPFLNGFKWNWFS